jgi:outer membrane murein-binding lipoprotein Lpp
MQSILDGNLFGVFIGWIIAAGINGVVGIIIGREKEGTIAGHFWTAFVFGVWGLCYIAAKRDEASTDYLSGSIHLLENRVAELEARLDQVSPDTKGRKYTSVKSNSRMSPLSTAYAQNASSSGPAGEAARKGYRKMCTQCKLSYSMRDEECTQCHGSLAVVNDTILTDV